MKKFFFLMIAFIGLLAVNAAYALPSFWYSGIAYTSAGAVKVTGTIDINVDITGGTTQTFADVPVDPFGVFTVQLASGNPATLTAATKIKVTVTEVDGSDVTDYVIINQTLAPSYFAQYVSTGANTLQTAYENGNTIITNSTDGDLTIGGSQSVSIQTTNGLTVTGDISVGDDIFAASDLLFFTETGAIRNTFSPANPVLVDDNLQVNGTSTLTGAVTASAGLTDESDVEGSDPADVDWYITDLGGASFNDGITVNGFFTVNPANGNVNAGDIFTNTAIAVGGNSTLGTDLADLIYLNGTISNNIGVLPVTIADNVAVTGNFATTGTVGVGTDLGVGGNTTLTGTFGFDGEGTVNSIISDLDGDPITVTNSQLPTALAVSTAIAAAASSANAEPYITFGTSTNLTAEKVLTEGNGIDIAISGTDGGTATVALANGTAAGQVYVTSAEPYQPTLVTMAGDAVIASDGTVTIQDGAVALSNIIESTVADDVMLTPNPVGDPVWGKIADANVATTAEIAVSKLANGAGGPQTLRTDGTDVFWGSVANLTPGAGISSTGDYNGYDARTFNIDHNATLTTGAGAVGDVLGINLANANSWSATQTFANVDITGNLTFDGSETEAVNAITETVNSSSTDAQLPTALSVWTAIDGASDALAGSDFITWSDETTTLPNSKLVVGGDGLTFTAASATFAVNVDGTTIGITTDVLGVVADGIGPTQINETSTYTWSGNNTYSGTSNFTADVTLNGVGTDLTVGGTLGVTGTSTFTGEGTFANGITDESDDTTIDWYIADNGNATLANLGLNGSLQLTGNISNPSDPAVNIDDGLSVSGNTSITGTLEVSSSIEGGSSLTLGDEGTAGTIVLNDADDENPDITGTIQTANLTTSNKTWTFPNETGTVLLSTTIGDAFADLTLGTGLSFTDNDPNAYDGSEAKVINLVLSGSTLDNTAGLKVAEGGITATEIATSAVTSTEIDDETIVDADISPTAEIAVSKLANGTARQLLQTDASGTGVEWTSNVDVPGTLDVTGAATFDDNASVGGTLGVTGATTLTGTATMNGATTLNKTLTMGVTAVTDLADLDDASTSFIQYSVGGTIDASSATEDQRLPVVTAGTIVHIQNTHTSNTLSIDNLLGDNNLITLYPNDMATLMYTGAGWVFVQ